MPTSHPVLLTPIATKILDLKPTSVLDIGCGFGKWGALAREYADIWWWRFYANEWIVKIHGIEYFQKYRSPNWDMYNEIFIGKAQDILPGLGQYDLMIMMEVLEHIEKDAAKLLLVEMMSHTNKLIISYSNCEQADVRDNPLENHISKWETSDFAELGNVEWLYKDEVTGVAFITK